MTGIDSSRSGVFWFFQFFQNLPASPVHFGVFEVSVEFLKFRNFLNTSRLRKQVVMTENNPKKTDNNIDQNFPSSTQA